MTDFKRILYPELTVKNKLPLNLLKEDLPLFETAIAEKIPASHCWHLQNALILKDTIFRNFRFWQEYYHYTRLSVKSRLKRLVLSTFFKKKIEKGVWITDVRSNNYFHWFADSLPRLIAVHPLLSGHTILLPRQYKTIGHVTQSLDRLNYPYVFIDDKVPYIIQDLLLPSHIARTGNFQPDVIKMVRDNFVVSKVSKKPFRKIFISREHAQIRKLLNEKYFVTQLKEFNFEIHKFEEYSLARQIELMNECSLLVGLHGAGLTNMLFMQSGTSVMELRKEDDDSNNCYFSMASALDLNYYYLKCKADHTSTQNANFEITDEQVKNFVAILSKDFHPSINS